MPRITVVIPAFNAAPFIEATLRSVIAQTDADWEAIVVDNHSSDGTARLAEALGDSRIQVVSFQNRGVIAASRNEGARLAKGAWLAFLDADDLWHPQKIAECMRQIEPDTNLFAHGLRYFGETRAAWAVSPGRSARCDVRKLLFSRRNPLGTSAVLVRKSAFTEIGGFDTRSEVVTVEDWDLWLRLAERGKKVQCIPDILGEYRLHAQSTGVASGPERQLRAGLFVLNQHFAQLVPRGLLDDWRRTRKESVFYYTAGRKLHDAGCFVEAIVYYWKALKRHPLSAHTLAALLLSYLKIAPRQQNARKLS